MTMKIPNLGLFVKDRDIVESDFGPLRMDKEKINKFSFGHRSSVRLSSGKYYTDEDFEKRKKEVFGVPLP